MSAGRFVADQMRQHVWGGASFGVPPDHAAYGNFYPAAYEPHMYGEGYKLPENSYGKFGATGLSVCEQIPGDPTADRGLFKRYLWGRAVVLTSLDPSFNAMVQDHPEAEPVVYSSFYKHVYMLGGLGVRLDQGLGTVELGGQRRPAHALRLGPDPSRHGFGFRMPGRKDIHSPSYQRIPYDVEVVDLSAIGKPGGRFEHVNVS